MEMSVPQGHSESFRDQVLSILTEVRELRERLASMCVETRAPSPTYSTYEEEPMIEVTPTEQQITRKYEQMDIDDILSSAPRGTRPTPPVASMLDATDDIDAPGNIADMLDFDDTTPVI